MMIKFMPCWYVT